MPERRRIIVGGNVQGVGFRPFTARLADQLGLSGFVRNCGDQVLIETEGDPEASGRFVKELHKSSPGHIDYCRTQEIAPAAGRGFLIEESLNSGHFHGHVPLDRAPCADCLKEFRDPGNRRYRYPLITCSLCGPRFTIMSRFPWDRVNTSMQPFAMCSRCKTEFSDPGDRRFHAQTISCWECGPEIFLTYSRQNAGDQERTGLNALKAATQLVAAGSIIAIKGIGGYQLIARADGPAALSRLREWKRRPDKPFALMAGDLNKAAVFGTVDTAAADMLQSPDRPIVLLKKSADMQPLCEQMAPDNPYIGIMLPPTPLHQYFADHLRLPLIVTSANRPETPICTDEADITCWFGDIAEALLSYNRAIVNRADDPVVHMTGGRPTWLRHGRGTAPVILPICDDNDIQSHLAAGAELKNAGAVSRPGYVLLSQHIGNMKGNRTLTFFNDAISTLASMSDSQPEAVLCDLHPEYSSHVWAENLRLPRRNIQHHVAHIASCMLEHNLNDRITGFAWDGTGYGPDKTIWGGETFRVSGGFRRVASFRPFQLLGGDRAAREPWRTLLALLTQVMNHCQAGALLKSLVPSASALTDAAVRALGTSVPVSCSSAGRLFDGISALIGAAPFVQTYDGQAPLALERLAWKSDTDQHLAFEVTQSGDLIHYDWRPTVNAILDAVRNGEQASVIARSFHNTLAEVITSIAARNDFPDVVLSGGVFQNRLLTETVILKLEAAGFRVFRNQVVPGNDAGIAAGQIYANHLLRKESHVSFYPC